MTTLIAKFTLFKFHVCVKNIFVHMLCRVSINYSYVYKYEQYFYMYILKCFGTIVVYKKKIIII